MNRRSSAYDRGYVDGLAFGHRSHALGMALILLRKDGDKDPLTLAAQCLGAAASPAVRDRLRAVQATDSFMSRYEALVEVFDQAHGVGGPVRVVDSPPAVDDATPGGPARRRFARWFR